VSGLVQSSFSASANDQIDRQDVYGFVRNGVVVSQGLDELEQILKKTDFKIGRNVSLYDAIQAYLIATRIFAYAANGEWEGLLVIASKYTAYSIVRQTTIGQVLGSSWSIAPFAALPIELALNSFMQIVNDDCYKNQIEFYFLARDQDVTHQQILDGKNIINPIVVTFRDYSKWIYDLEGKKTAGAYISHCKPANDLTPKQVYSIAGELYEILRNSDRLRKELRNEKISLIDRLDFVTSKSDHLLTTCGSKWYQRFGLQLLEIEQGIRGQYTFDGVCGAHDQCYSDCVTLREECAKIY